MKNVVLIGMPGTGKSTVGVILAKRLGYGFLDTDILLAETEHRKLPEIIADRGYEEFIRIEGRLGALIEREKCVIATGGSMVFSEKAMGICAGMPLWCGWIRRLRSLKSGLSQTAFPAALRHRMI